MAEPSVIVVTHFCMYDTPKHCRDKFAARLTVLDADGDWLFSSPFKTKEVALAHAGTLQVGARLMGHRGSLPIAVVELEFDVHPADFDRGAVMPHFGPHLVYRMWWPR
jgi:hypothetical protein